MVSLGQVVGYEDEVNEHSFILSELRQEIKHIRRGAAMRANARPVSVPVSVSVPEKAFKTRELHWFLLKDFLSSDDR